MEFDIMLEEKYIFYIFNKTHYLHLLLHHDVFWT